MERKAEQGAPAARLTWERRAALEQSPSWQAKANRAARTHAPRIYPCGACGEPVVDGYCCPSCCDPQPYRYAESGNSPHSVDSWNGTSMKDFNAEGAQARVPRTYSVNVYDCAGQYSETACPDFPAALAEYRASRAKYPGKVVAVFNYDRCDERYDGLTEDEREALDD